MAAAALSWPIPQARDTGPGGRAGGDFRVEVFNLLGTKVVEDRCEQGRNLINVSYLTPGTYLILVESNGKIHLEKMQKK